ncbi:MAG: hypothetical protein HZC40_07875 [Chloroflexi bacterium]|nr:hypothetical protein [Chloroflexota bacterium]
MWIIYNVLAQIADTRGKPDEAVQWRRKSQDSFAAYPGAGYQLQKYQTLLQRIIAACRGDVESRKWVEGEFPRMQASGEEWAQNANVILRILNGETDFEKLRDGLSYLSAYLVRAIVEGLAGNKTFMVFETSKVSDADAQTQPAPEQEQGITLDQLLGYVVVACKPGAPAGLAEQLHALTHQLAADANAPAEIRALGSALNHILSGERAPDVSALPPQLADAVRGVVEEIRNS